MAKTRQQKEEAVKQMANDFSEAKSTVFVDFSGLSVSEIREFRRACREQNLKYTVAKKTLLDLALKQAKLDDVDLAQFESGIGTVFGSDDVVTPAKAVKTFAKEHENMTILGGVMTENAEGQRFMAIDKVEALADLPSREELLAKLLGSINAPVSGFVNVLAGNVRGLVTVLSQIKDQKEA